VRQLRRVVYFIVPAMGMALVLGAVIFGERLLVQLFLVVAGLLMTEAGFARWADSILPDERRYLPLRAETEHFVALVRQLNTVAVALAEREDGAPPFALDEVQSEMHRSVDRMVDLAGRTAEHTGQHTLD
jgi:hypothetical protein